MAGDLDLEARERMAREWGEERDPVLTEWMISLEKLPLSCPAGLPPHEFYVLQAILEGEVVLPPSSGSEGRDG